MNLKVSEIFYSLQGEGRTLGCPSVFVRLMGCNLICGGDKTQIDKQLHNNATWRCDSIEVWLKGTDKNIKNVINNTCLEALKNNAHLIITGGEPLLQQNEITELISYVRKEINKNVFVEIETNGTIEPISSLKKNVNLWSVSPKLSNSGMIPRKRINLEVIKNFVNLNSQFKFVITNKDDFKEIQNDYNIIPKQMLILMPSGENRELLLKSRKVVAEICKENYINMTTRLHIDIWNKKTGV